MGVGKLSIMQSGTLKLNKITISKNRTIIVKELETQHICLEEGVKLTFILIATDGFQEPAKVTFELKGAGAELKFLGFIVGKKEKIFPFETVSLHRAPNTKAHYNVKAVMFDHSQVDYKGNIIIEKSAQMTDSYLSHHTLLMSEHARAKSIPALEILADDVKAGHSASIGKVDEEMMFYLKSRGIEDNEAEQMLVNGFFESQLATIMDENLRERARTAIIGSLTT